MANSPKDDTDLSAIPLKKLDAILNQIQKQNSQINELSAENEKLRSLLARANAENNSRNEIVEGFKSMLFKVGQTSEAGIVSKFLQSTKQEEIQEQPPIQTSIFGAFSFIIVATIKFVVIIKEFLCHLKLQGMLFHSKKRLF